MYFISLKDIFVCFSEGEELGLCVNEDAPDGTDDDRLGSRENSEVGCAVVVMTGVVLGLVIWISRINVVGL
jgi:hypothetical protein